jgi:hypothetical protein
MAVNLCAGMAETYALKILLNRGEVIAAPYGLHFDAYRNKFKKTWRPSGNRGFLPKLMFKIARKIVLAPNQLTKKSDDLKPIEEVFEYAKWAPSGDNMQPLRIEVLTDLTCVIHGSDTRDHVVYDLEGNASKLALGAFIENCKIASQSINYEQTVDLTTNKEEKAPDHEEYSLYPTFTLTLTPAKEKLEQHTLFPYIKTRCVQRKRMGTKPLTVIEKQKLTDALPKGYSIIWKETLAERWAVAKFMYGNATTRFSMKEGYDVHSKIMEFTPISQDSSAEKNCNSTFSKDKLPAKSLGIDPITIALTKWTLASWPRFRFLDKYLGGTTVPKLLLDVATSMKSCAHFIIIADAEPKSLEDYLAAGAAMQRFWLKATQLQLGFQPEQTPVIFSEYLRNRVDFTTDEFTKKNVISIDKDFKSLIGEEKVKRAVFMGRLGRTTTPTSRSVRLSLDELRYKQEDTEAE